MTLAQALLAMKNEKEMNNFLRDLCTPGEIKDFTERWTIAQLLNEGEMSYREIADEARASVTTVTRVARFLKDEPYQGYTTALSRRKHHRV